MSNTTGAVVAAMRLRKEREIVATLKEQSALTPAAAAKLSPPQMLGRSALKGLMRSGAVIETSPGHYYLDEAAYAARRSQRQRRMTVLIVAALLVVAVLFVLSGNR